MSPIIGYITDVLREEFDVPAELLTPDTPFEEMSIDSLVLLELAVIVERQLGVVVEEGELTEEQTLGEAAALLEAKGAVLR
jgi:acyl carrier protein